MAFEDLDWRQGILAGTSSTASPASPGWLLGGAEEQSPSAPLATRANAPGGIAGVLEQGGMGQELFQAPVSPPGMAPPPEVSWIEAQMFPRYAAMKQARYQNLLGLQKYQWEQQRLNEQKQFLQGTTDIDWNDPDQMKAMGYEALSFNMPQVAEKLFSEAKRYQDRHELTMYQRAGIQAPLIRAAQVTNTAASRTNKIMSEYGWNYDQVNHNDAIAITTMVQRAVAESALSDTEFGRAVAPSLSAEEALNYVKKLVGMDPNAPSGRALEQMVHTINTLAEDAMGQVQGEFRNLLGSKGQGPTGPRPRAGLTKQLVNQGARGEDVGQFKPVPKGWQDMVNQFGSLNPVAEQNRRAAGRGPVIGRVPPENQWDAMAPFYRMLDMMGESP